MAGDGITTELSAILEDMAKGLDYTRETWTERVEAAGQVIADRLTKRLQKQPDAPDPPLNWDSTKQRQAFFASGGTFDGTQHSGDSKFDNIPHVRTGELPESWQSFVHFKGKTLTAGTTSAFTGARYTRDQDDQSNIFRGFYPTLEEILVEEEDFIQEVLQGLVKETLESMLGTKYHGETITSVAPGAGGHQQYRTASGRFGPMRGR